MPATCRCKNGHVFSSRVVEDSPDINYLEVANDTCPDCGTEEFEIEDISYEDYYDHDLEWDE